MSHIIGRPNDDLLDVMLGYGADPEQAFIDGSEPGLEEGDGLEDRLLRDDRPHRFGAVGLATPSLRRLARQTGPAVKRRALSTWRPPRPAGA